MLVRIHWQLNDESRVQSSNVNRRKKEKDFRVFAHLNDMCRRREKKTIKYLLIDVSIIYAQT
jgi:hypothetical protein